MGTLYQGSPSRQWPAARKTCYEIDVALRLKVTTLTSGARPVTFATAIRRIRRARCGSLVGHLLQAHVKRIPRAIIVTARRSK